MSKISRIGLAAVAVGLMLVPAVALGGTARTASNSTTYPDSIGEDPLAPDITSTTVANDDTGLITFHVAISNRPALTPDMLLEIDLDTDGNPATGDPQGLAPGTDYLIQLVPGSVNLFKWSGSDYPAATSPSLVYSYDATGATIRINASDLGNTRAFNFGVFVVSGLTYDANGNLVGTNAHPDFSPDQGHGSFSYKVDVKVTLSAVAFTTSPKPVRAGKPLSASLAVNESDTGSGVTQGTVTCAATIAGKRIAARTSRLVNGVAICIWAIPKTAKGKRIQGSVALDTQGAHIARTFSQKIS